MRGFSGVGVWRVTVRIHGAAERKILPCGGAFKLLATGELGCSVHCIVLRIL